MNFLKSYITSFSRLSKLLVFVLLVTFYNLPNYSYAQEKLDSLPNFTFYKLDGMTFSKREMPKNERSIFILFDAGCGHCQHEIVDIGRQYSSFKHVNFYLVSLDEKVAIDKFMSYYGKYLKDKRNVFVLQDKELEFIPKFKPSKYPGIFLYSKTGKFIYSSCGTTPVKNIIKALKKDEW